MGTYLVQEVAVVGHDDNRIFKVNQEIFEPVDRLDVQTVGWLVQKKNIRLTKEGLSQEDLNLLTVGQFAHVLVVEVF